MTRYKIFSLFFLASSSIHAQHVSNFRIDHELFQKTLETICYVWTSDSSTHEYDVDTVLCSLVARIDSIDFDELVHNEIDLKNYVKLKIRDNGFYECNCYFVDKNGFEIGTVGSFDFYRVMLNFGDQRQRHHLSLRYLSQNDQLVMYPLSRKYLFAAKWYMSITAEGELVWYDSSYPEESYDLERLYRSERADFILK